jgi:pimeloyl-ACP methyl ester carboxylesterase
VFSGQAHVNVADPQTTFDRAGCGSRGDTARKRRRPDAGTASHQSPAPVDVVSGFVTVGAGRVFYEAAGQGRALVLIHDGILHRETWDAQFPEFSRSFRTVRRDRRGYGQSPAPQSPFSHVDDLHEVMKAQVPTLLIAGESDIPDVHAHMGAIQAGIPGAKRVVLPRAGHLPHLEVPEAFNAEVTKFLASR